MQAARRVRLSSIIIRGPNRSKNDRHRCMWNRRIRLDSFQEILHKTQHSVDYVVHKERALAVALSCPLGPWPQERLAFYDTEIPMKARVIALLTMRLVYFPFAWTSFLKRKYLYTLCLTVPITSVDKIWKRYDNPVKQDQQSPEIPKPAVRGTYYQEWTSPWRKIVVEHWTLLNRTLNSFEHWNIFWIQCRNSDEPLHLFFTLKVKKDM